MNLKPYRLLPLLLVGLLLLLPACRRAEQPDLPDTDPAVTTQTPTTDPTETDPPVTNPPDTDPPVTNPPDTDPPETKPVELYKPSAPIVPAATVHVSLNGTVTPIVQPTGEAEPLKNDALDWTSRDPSVFSVDEKGVITGIAAGSGTCVATDSKTDREYSFSVTVHPMPEGCYMLQNKDSGMVLGVGHAVDSQLIRQQESHGDDKQKWKITLDEDGYYRFQLLAGGAENGYLMMTATHDYIGCPILLEIVASASPNESTGSRWTVEATDASTYRLISAWPSHGCVQIDSSVIEEPNISILAREYSSSASGFEWILVPCDK